MIRLRRTSNGGSWVLLRWSLMGLPQALMPGGRLGGRPGKVPGARKRVLQPFHAMHSNLLQTPVLRILLYHCTLACLNRPQCTFFCSEECRRRAQPLHRLPVHH